VGDISGLSGIEVLIGLSFMFFLLSTACSAVQEVLAGVFGWRAKTLEDAVGNILGDPKVKRGWKEWCGRVDKRGVKDESVEKQHAEVGMPADLTSEVFAHWRIGGLVRDPRSSLRRRSRPSYVPPRALSLAVAESLAGSAASAEAPPAEDAKPTPWAKTDAQILAGVRKALARLPADHPREVLQKAAAHAGDDLERFRQHVETAFDDAMERASGWYKRKAQVVLAVVATVFAIGLNVDTVQVATHLYNDEAVRTAVVSKVDKSKEPQDAADAVSQVKQLRLPVGWGGENSPEDLSGAIKRAPGWIITIAALLLGAPFWFDVLSRLSRQRASGIPEKPGRRLSDKPVPGVDSPPPAASAGAG
jgi:hypothetical protein